MCLELIIECQSFVHNKYEIIYYYVSRLRSKCPKQCTLFFRWHDDVHPLVLSARAHRHGEAGTWPHRRNIRFETQRPSQCCMYRGYLLRAHLQWVLQVSWDIFINNVRSKLIYFAYILYLRMCHFFSLEKWTLVAFNYI